MVSARQKKLQYISCRAARIWSTISHLEETVSGERKGNAIFPTRHTFQEGLVEKATTVAIGYSEIVPCKDCGRGR